MERVAALKERAKSYSARAHAYPDGLTEREAEVLRLVVTGKRDREIAEALFISVTTVSTHVRNILNKINAANRTEATAYAAQHGLL
jgi:DNA-binding NarL/FixJ family response regulator